MPRHCPECSLPLETRRNRRVEIDICLPCQGAWFDVRELSQTISGPGGRPTGFTAFFDEQRLRVAASTVLKCPVCTDSSMDRVALGEVSAVRCARCRGVWISAESLGRLCSQLGAIRSAVDGSEPGTNPWKVVGDILAFALELLTC